MGVNIELDFGEATFGLASQTLTLNPMLLSLNPRGQFSPKIDLTLTLTSSWSNHYNFLTLTLTLTLTLIQATVANGCAIDQAITAHCRGLAEGIQVPDQG